MQGRRDDVAPQGEDGGPATRERVAVPPAATTRPPQGSPTGLLQFLSSARAWGAASPPRPPGEAERRSEPLARRLLLLVLAIVAPLILFRATTLWLEYAAGREQAEARLVGQARSMARLVDLEFDRVEGVALGLAASSALARGDLDGFDAEMRTAGDRLSAALRPGNAKPKLSLFAASGDRLLYTAWAPGERPDGVPGLPYVQAAIASGQTRTSDLILSGDPPCAAVAVPVLARDAEDGVRVAGAIAVTVARERLLDLTMEADLSPGGVASVQNRSGITVARSLRDAEALGEPTVPAVLRVILGAEADLVPWGTRTLEGVPSTIAFAHAPRSGFIVRLAIPEEAFLAPIRASLLQTAAIGITAVTLALLLALMLARRIVATFGRVPRAVSGALAGGRPPAPIGLREADELAGTLAAILAERGRVAADARILFESSPVAVILGDTGGRVHAANGAFLELVGRSRDELEAGAVRWDEMTPQEGIASDEAAIAQAVATGRCKPYEKEYRRPDGTRVPVLVSFCLLDRTVGTAAAFIVDLTERREAEEALRRSESFARSILTGTSDCIIVLDPEDRVEFMNEPGRCQKEIDDLSRVIGRRVDSLWPEESAPAVRRALAEARASGIARYTAFGPTAKGTPKWWDVTVTRLPGAEGTAPRLLSVARDVTEARHAEAALAESEARFRAITDAMPQMVWSTRPDGHHDFYNRRWYELTGTTPEQSDGEGWNPVFHPEDQPRAWATWQHSLETGEPYEIEYRLRMADGTYRWMLGRALPVRDPATGAITRWFGTCTDIEETVAAREALARSREELEAIVEERTLHLQETQARLAQAQRMEALGQLAGGIAHDFNNVLQAVQGGAGLIERRPTDPESVGRLARMVREASGRGAAVTRRLLAFSRKGDLRAEPIDVSGLLGGIKEILEHTLGVGIEVRAEAAAGLPPLLADKGQLETVLVNLATNARDAMQGPASFALRPQSTMSRNRAGSAAPMRSHPATTCASP